MKTSEQVNEIFTALSKAQGEFKVALKDAENPFFKSSYADFQSVVDAARPALAKHGLGFIQMTRADDKFPLVLVTRIFHTSGQWIEGEYPVRTVKEDPQSLGAATTYSKRYALQAALGVVAANDDDDAEKAMDHKSEDRVASKAQTTGIMKAFAGLGVSETQVLTFLGIKSQSEIKESDLSHLSQIGKDIKSGKSKVNDHFIPNAAKGQP